MALLDNVFAGEAGVANIILKTLGITGVFTHYESTYDPRTDITETKETKKAVTVSPPLKYSVDEIKTYGVTQEDTKFIGNGFDFTEVNNDVDTLLVNGGVYKIIKRFPVYSGTEIAMVSLQTRLQAGE